MKKIAIICFLFLGAIACKNGDSNLAIKEVALSEPPPMDKSAPVPPPPPPPPSGMEKRAKSTEALESKDVDEAAFDTTSQTASATNNPTNTSFKTSSSSNSGAAAALLSRKIIRQAQVKFKAAATENTTYAVETKAKMWGGYVVESNLNNSVLNQRTMPVSRDSVMQVTHYQLVNNMVVRLPNRHLDSFLAEISRHFKHLDYRHVSAEDVTLPYLENELKAQIRDETARRIQKSVDNRGGRINSIVEAETAAAQMQDAAVEQQISNAEKNFNVQYSLVRLEIYQDQDIVKTTVANPSLAAFTPSFGARFSEAFSTGWAVVLDMFFGLVSVWYIFAILGLAYFFYKKFDLRAFFNRKNLVAE